MKAVNTAASVRYRLKEKADSLGLEFQSAVQYYAIERFLFRLSKSTWADRLVVKGAVMLRVWDGAVARPTRDIDFLGRVPNTPEHVEAIVAECLAIQVDDGMVFAEEVRAQAIKVAERYPGVRVRVTGDLAGARFVLWVDIGVDDAVVPEPSWVDYPTLLAGEMPRVLAYRPATAIAEKAHAMVDLGLANSRLKDYYDIWMLSKSVTIEGNELREALVATFSKRDTALPLATPAGLSDAFASNADARVRWQAYRASLAKSGIEAPDDLTEVLADVASFVGPALAAAVSDGRFEQQWTPEGGWQGMGK